MQQEIAEIKAQNVLDRELMKAIYEKVNMVSQPAGSSKRAVAESPKGHNNQEESRYHQVRILTTERAAETSATMQRHNTFTSRYVNAPTAGKLLLGGDVGLECDVS